MKRSALFAFIFFIAAWFIPAVHAAPAPASADVPTLLLTGSLEGTLPVAATCRPFTFRYRALSAGNVPPTNGTLKIEVRSTGMGQMVYAQQIPFSLDAGTNRIEKLDFPRGTYTVTLRASAVNQQKGMPADFLLAEQALTVSGPAEVRRSTASLPRVLVWAGEDYAKTIERVLKEKILKEAFPSESIYLKTVASAEDFTNYALTGLYNTYVLLDIDGAPDIAEVLRHGVAKGHGIILAGSGERTRAVAEALDFRFGDPLPQGRRNITFPTDSGLGITGTLPVSGRFPPPKKRGARAAALLPDGRPAILVDVRDKGTVIVMPFSLTQSALNAGTTTLYSLLVRSAVFAAAPEREEPGSLAPVQFLVSSPSGPVKTRIVETLPPGSQVVWTSIPHTVKEGTLTFEIMADNEPQKVLYLFQPAVTGAGKVSTEVLTECDGKFVSQGKVE